MDELSVLRIIAQDPEFIAYGGELMLSSKREGKQRWQVSFDVPMDTESHPFNKYHGRASGKTGTRFVAIMIEIDDDDYPINQGMKTLVKSNSMHNLEGKKLVQESGMMRRDIMFHRYLWKYIQEMPEEKRTQLEGEMPHILFSEIKETGGKILSDEKKGVRFANHVVHYLCGVYSCREFAYNKEAADKFNTLRNNYIQWLNNRNRR